MAGVNQIFSLAADDVAKYVKTCGKRFLPEAKPSIFHGINPTISYAPSGKTFELPRFCTEEMKTARELNKIACRQIKLSGTVPKFAKATADDLRRLTSETLEDSYSRVRWVNPKDGKTYNLLKQGQIDDGKVLVRILDEDGGFVKEAVLTPKKVIIYDSDNKKVDLGKYYEQLSHGETVKRFAQRANPFADIEFVNVDHVREQNSFFNIHLNLDDELKDLSKRIDQGDNVDYISLSLGLNATIFKPSAMLEKTAKTLNEFKTTVTSFPTSELIEQHPNVRILQAAGNSGKEIISPDLMFKGVEGVGALDTAGKVAEFSSTRTSLLTQHYEPGVFRKTPTKYGLGFFDGYSTDIAIRPDYLERAQGYLGKKPKIVCNSLRNRMVALREIAEKKYKAEYKVRRTLVVSAEEEAKLEELKQLMRAEKNPVKQKVANDEYWKYHRELHQKVKKAMEGYENPEGIEYKDFIEYMQENNLVCASSRGEFYTMQRTPYETDFDRMHFIQDADGNLIFSPASKIFPVQGTSFSTPIRTAKLALNDMMDGIL